MSVILYSSTPSQIFKFSFSCSNKTLLFVGIFVKVNSLITLTFVLRVRCWHMIGQLIFHSVYTCPEKHLNFGLLDIAFLWLLSTLSCYYEIITWFEGDKRVVSLTWIYILLYINLLNKITNNNSRTPYCFRAWCPRVSVGYYNIPRWICRGILSGRRERGRGNGNTSSVPIRDAGFAGGKTF
jgi:hypothetical protein